MNEEPTKIPRSGSQYRGTRSHVPTDKVLEDAATRGQKAVSVIKNALAFGGSGGTGSAIGQVLAEVLGVPDVKWWMTGGAAIGFHLAVVIADVATRALGRINAVANKAENIGTKVELALGQLAAIAKQMEAGRAVHNSLGQRVTALEAEAAARKEELEREDLLQQAARLGITFDHDATLEEMRKAIKRATSKGVLRPVRRPNTDETAVPPPESFDVELRPEGS